MSASCRFYKHRYPKQEDVVMVNVRSIAEMGAYVTLLEYNNIEGMIMLSELSRRRIRSINKLVRIGRNECVVVIRVDETKGEKLEPYGVNSNYCPPKILHHRDNNYDHVVKLDLPWPLDCFFGSLKSCAFLYLMYRVH